MNIKHIVLLGALLLTGIEHVSAQEDNFRKADEMNRLAESAYARTKRTTHKDSLEIYRAVVDGVKFTLKCDEYDRLPNQNKLIEPRFENENAKRIQALYPRLIDAGLYLLKGPYTHLEGMETMKFYLASRNNRLLADMPDESGLAAYNLAYYNLKARNLKDANEYADMAMQYDETALGAAEIKAQCMSREMVTANDSLRYLAVIKKLYETDPTNKTYFSWIMRFYQHPTPRFNLEDFVDKQLEENFGSVIPWILKGEIAMNARRWDEAIEAYKQADEIDPNIIPVIFNIGVSLNQKGVEIRKAVVARRKKGQKASNKEVLDIFIQARTYLERVRAKDPRRNKVDWVEPLYMDYIILNEKTKAAELEPLVSKFKK